MQHALALCYQHNNLYKRTACQHVNSCSLWYTVPCWTMSHTPLHATKLACCGHSRRSSTPCTTTRCCPVAPSAVSDMATETLMASALVELASSGCSTMMVDALLAAT